MYNQNVPLIGIGRRRRRSNKHGLFRNAREGKKLTHVLYESKAYQSFEVNEFPHKEIKIVAKNVQLLENKRNSHWLIWVILSYIFFTC